MDIDILVITETKKKGNGTELIGNNIHIWSGVNKDQRAQAGVGVIIKRKYRRNIKSWEPINERIIKLNLTLHGRKIVVLGAYGPTEDSTTLEKDTFMDSLQNEIAAIKANEELILTGDLNGRVGKKENDEAVGRYGEDVTNNNGERLIEICELHDLKITNGYYKHKDIHKYTWIQHKRNLKSIIDYVIVRKGTSIRIKDVRVQRGAECGSDHRLLLAKMEFTWKNKGTHTTKETREVRAIKEKKLKTHLLLDESIRDLYQRRLDQKLLEFNFEDDISKIYEHIKESMKQAGLEALGEKEEDNKVHKWNLTESTLQQIKNKKQLYSRWMSTKDEEDYKKYRQKDKEVKKLVIKEKNKAWEQACTNIDQHIGGTKSSEAWRTLKALRSNKQEKTQISHIPEHEWEAYYKDLLIETRHQFLNSTEKETDDLTEEDLTVTQEETRSAIRSMKNNKAPGPGGIMAELVKYGTEKLWRILRRLFERILNGENIPREWKEAHITSVFKKGDRNKCGNYRGISVLPTMGRLYGRIIRAKLENNIKGKIGEEQAGFTAGRSCLDHIHTIQQLIEKKKAKNRDVHLAFVDLKKAYDTVPRKRLWGAMRRLEIPGRLIRAVRNLYENNRAHIKSGNRIICGLDTSKGLLQGCPTSPTLFKIFLEDTLRPWKEKCQGMGINIRDEQLYTLCFADDQVVIAQDEEDLSYMLRKLQEEYQKAGLEINFKKTEYLATNEEDVTNLELEGNLEIKGTRTFKYLGFIISKSTTTEEDISSRLGQARTAIRQLHPVIWDKNIRIKTKQMIFNSIVQSIMTYASEIWVINKKNRGKILATEMEYWRRCCGLTKMNRVTNEEIRRRMQVENDILKHIEEKRLVWYGHVRRAQNQWINKITEWSPVGKRKRGRPRRSWRDEVDESMETRGLSDNDWQNRTEWKSWLKKGRRHQS